MLELIQSDLLSAVHAYARPSVDLILAADVLCYLGDLTAFLEAVGRALRPGGRFAFTFDLLEGSEDYCLIPLMHFAHSLHYLQNLACKNQLREVAVQQIYGLRENGYYGRGLLMVLERATSFSAE